MDPLVLVVLAMTLVGGFVLLFVRHICGPHRSSALILRKCVETKASVEGFLARRTENIDSNLCFMFREKMVSCRKHSFRGRFDQAVFRFGQIPTLVMVVERKFPTYHLPTKGRPEDFFQAGLYSLAIESRGVDCRGTILLLIYCKQTDASSCTNRSLSSRCMMCSKGRTFTSSYKPSQVLGVLRRLDEIWYAGRKPNASPNPSKCAGCAFGRSGECGFSALKQKSHLGKWF
jgi:hypothetical protein